MSPCVLPSLVVHRCPGRNGECGVGSAAAAAASPREERTIGKQRQHCGGGGGGGSSGTVVDGMVEWVLASSSSSWCSDSDATSAWK